MPHHLSRCQKGDKLAHGVPVCIDLVHIGNVFRKKLWIDKRHVNHKRTGGCVEVEIHLVAHPVDFGGKKTHSLYDMRGIDLAQSPLAYMVPPLAVCGRQSLGIHLLKIESHRPLAHFMAERDKPFGDPGTRKGRAGILQDIQNEKFLSFLFLLHWQNTS
ncbi:MAG: hypothetical protein A4E65_02763 [Syntrophorhabdus sp. PtaU1.Bin153]|nr:MAG: hypothetical protein A4E65_02763 [Syntrophorhabdus sp. PtaU1.Bin153]